MRKLVLCLAFLAVALPCQAAVDPVTVTLIRWPYT